MSRLWIPIDKLGLWLADSWTPLYQIRTGVIMILMSIAYLLYMPFSGEQPGIYSMSAFAILFSGPATIAVGIYAMSRREQFLLRRKARK